MLNVLVTGGNGFVGKAILNQLVINNYLPKVVSRVSYKFKEQFKEVLISGINIDTDWREPLDECDIVIHLAARVHIMNDVSSDPLAEFRKVNTDGTLHLARQAAKAGVKRFIYLSSIKVNGEATVNGNKFSPDDSFIPKDPYGLSKFEAEQGLHEIAKETGMEVVIIRPPLVYGPGVKANFASMIKWVNKSVPLPFGLIKNQRSLVAIDNLVSFIIRCIDHPKAANEVFLISDGEDVSTSELLRKVAKALGEKSLLIPIPVGLMSLVAKFLGKEDMADRLFGSLQVDSSKTSDLLGWQPVITMDDELKKTVDSYLNEKVI